MVNNTYFTLFTANLITFLNIKKANLNSFAAKYSSPIQPPF